MLSVAFEPSIDIVWVSVEDSLPKKNLSIVLKFAESLTVKLDAPLFIEKLDEYTLPSTIMDAPLSIVMEPHRSS